MVVAVEWLFGFYLNKSSAVLVHILFFSFNDSIYGCVCIFVQILSPCILTLRYAFHVIFIERNIIANLNTHCTANKIIICVTQVELITTFLLI